MLIARLFFVFFPALIAWLICAAALQAIACPAPFWVALIPAAAVAAAGWIVTAPHPERGELEIAPELINREWPRRAPPKPVPNYAPPAVDFSSRTEVSLSDEIEALDKYLTSENIAARANAIASIIGAPLVTPDDIEAIEQPVGRSALSWDLVEPRELVTAILNHFNNKVQKA